jgi:histidyl-tRNA synthetase
MSKPSIPQGTRDFSAATVRKRNYILNTIKSVFELHGFQPLETPAMEQLQTLMGKYGEEGDRLIFKILNNGLYEKKDKATLQQAWEGILEKPSSSTLITERALRYDLTIPFARYVAMNFNELAMPYKRYQMQPVWRADRPQKGRYREFWQCDCDMVGSTSVFNEAELLAIYARVFKQLGIPQISIKINNRKILAAIAEFAGYEAQLTDITIALDKLDKVGWDGVEKELLDRSILADGIEKIRMIVAVQGDHTLILQHLRKHLAHIPVGLLGIEELESILAYVHALSAEATELVKLDLCLARGLNYYTGMIVEVGTTAVKMGSIGGGGRYDHLTDLFGVKGISGVGISFGVDRIYDVIEELNAFPETIYTDTQVLLLNTGKEFEIDNIEVLKALRVAGIRAEYYADTNKIDKQFKYANKRAIPFVIIIAEQEKTSQTISVKNLETGVQEALSIAQVVQTIQS